MNESDIERNSHTDELQVPKPSTSQRVSLQTSSPLSVSRPPSPDHQRPAEKLRLYLDSLMPQHPDPKTEVKSGMFWRAIRSEFIASFLLTVISSAAAIAPGIKDPIPSIIQQDDVSSEATVNVASELWSSSVTQNSSENYRWAEKWALAHALTLGALTWSIRNAHFSPSTTIALFVSGKISVLRTFVHILAQLIGCLLGAPVLIGLLPRAPILSHGATAAEGWGAEFLSTMLVSMISLSCYETSASARRASIPTIAVDDADTPHIAYGALLPLLAAHGSAAFFTADFTGIGLNPARSLALAIVTDNFKHHWVWWVGPVLGGVLAAFTHEYTGSKDQMRTRGINTPRPSIIPRDISRPSCITSTAVSPT